MRCETRIICDSDTHPNQTSTQILIDGALDGGDILPGFTLPLKDILQSPQPLT
jgi:hypothetical protein